MKTYVDFETLKQFMVEAFEKVGVPKKDAVLCVEVLLESDRRGIDSHGVNRFKPIYIDRIMAGIQSPTTHIDVVKETPTTLVLDGNNGMGMVIAHEAMKKTITKAKTYGIAMAVVRNSTHYGIAGYYASMATKEGLIGITGTNARPSIAPTFGVEPMLGTNPLTFGLPTDEDHDFILDCATSVTQRGKIELYAKEGKDTEEGKVIYKDGTTLTNSDFILEALLKGEAALAPLGGIGEELAGYKGYGYATVVEILSSALQAGSYLKMLTGLDENGKRKPYQLGHFFIVINPEAFMGEKTFREITGNILRSLRNSKKMPGVERIYTAGEKEYLASLKRKETGVLLNKKQLNEFAELKKILNLSSSITPNEKSVS